jgi:hypothetical protein
MEFWVRFPAAPLTFTIVIGKLETTCCITMAQFRIVRRPDQKSPLDSVFDVEEFAPYMSLNGECIGMCWSFVAGPFQILDYAELYAERAVGIAKADCFVVKEYD